MLNFSNIDFSIENHEREFCKSAGKTGLDIASVSWKNLLMENVQSEEILQEFGKRIQRCYGCFVSYYLKDMYLGEDVTFFCEHCKDDSMFHFDEFSKLLDIAKLREVEEDHHH